MATVFMRFLERRPADYERGISWLTLGRLPDLQQQLAERLVQEGDRALDIGCGTGSFSLSLARCGAEVTAVDQAPAMLAVAEARARQGGLHDQIDFRLTDALSIGDQFKAASFDLIVSSLAFSEFETTAQDSVLRSCADLLVPGGQLVILDEVAPDTVLSRLLFAAVRLPLTALTWLLTRTTTHPLRGFQARLERAGFEPQIAAHRLGGSLRVYQSTVVPEGERPRRLHRAAHRIQTRASLRTRLIDLWTLFFRIIPPYPKYAPGLYRVGSPGSESPLLVTGNFELTLRRLARALEGKCDVWVLAVDSKGVNVWCASGAELLTAEKVLGALIASEVGTIINHNDLILPQLAAPGVDSWLLRHKHWRVYWGPIRATDIPEYLKHGKVASEAMRQAIFPLKDRLEMVSTTLGFYGLLIFLPVLIFWRESFWPVTITLVGLSYFYALVEPWLPGREGLAKGASLALIALAGLVLASLFWPAEAPREMFNRALGVLALSIFVGAEFQGMSPLMRGEQANWSWEAIIGGVLGLTYFVTPLVLGWK